MTTLVVTSPTGVERPIDGEIGRSLMEVIRDNELDSALGLCGGCCACATCHVYVDPTWMEQLPPMQEDEEALLDGIESRQATSRLSCQIRLTDGMDGLRVTLAPEA